MVEKNLELDYNPSYKRRKAMFTLRRITKYFGEKLVLKDVSFSLWSNEVIALVGANGSGKSTMLKIIAGEIEPDEGSMEVSPGIKIAYFPQEIPPAEEDQTGREYLSRKTGDAGGRHIFELASSMDKLGFPQEKLETKISKMSGGERGKLALLSILSSGSDFFLLDEPTNNLDFVGLLLLEKFISSSQAGFLIVSHDRKFLNRLATSIIEMDEDKHSAEVFSNTKYHDYLEERKRKEAEKQKKYDDYASEKARLEKTVKAKKGEAQDQQKGPRVARDNDKYAAGFKRDKSKKLASRATSIEKRLGRMETIEKPRFRLPLNLRFNFTERSGDKVFSLSSAEYRNDGVSIGPINQTISYGERIVIMGPNGSGKSTLLKLLTGHLTPISGVVTMGARVRIGYLPQIMEIKGGETLLEYFMDNADIDQSNGRKILARFGFSGDAVKAVVGEMSPGERSRLILASLMAKDVNCLVLDEPTNHLDPEALDRLEEALEGFEGTVVIVSHDRYLVEKIRATKTLVLENSQLHPVRDYHEYERRILKG